MKADYAKTEFKYELSNFESAKERKVPPEIIASYLVEAAQWASIYLALKDMEAK